jgi:hypothetical protein
MKLLLLSHSKFCEYRTVSFAVLSRPCTSASLLGLGREGPGYGQLAVLRDAVPVFARDATQVVASSRDIYCVLWEQGEPLSCLRHEGTSDVFKSRSFVFVSI